MVTPSSGLQLAGYALGALGAGLVFIELFQTPSYINYDPEYDDYNMTVAPTELDEYTWAGRIGALLLALAFALLFVSVLVG